MPTFRLVLKETFGDDGFRLYPRKMIENALARHDTLAIMLNDHSKSLCYQILALFNAKEFAAGLSRKETT